MINNRTLVYLFFLIYISCENSIKTIQPPNVILIISDQWSVKVSDGSGDYDNGIETPSLDLLASQGISFTESYSTYPLCTPARASLFTGLYSHNNDVGFNLRRDSILERSKTTPTIGKSFKMAGYDVAYFGKEHAGGYGYASATEFGSMTHSDGGMLAEGSAYDPIFTQDAVEYIKNNEGDKPFFMTLSLINPHDICRVLGGKVAGATFADAIHFARTDDEPYLRFQPRPDLPKNHNISYEKGMILHEDFMYMKETALMDRGEHVKKMEKEFGSKQAINQNELLHEDEDMMAFKHVVTQKNGKKFRITQIQLYKEGMVWREISNAIEID